mgnify:CR=1 FL=1
MSLRLYFILIIALISVSSTSLIVRVLPSVPALTMAFWRMLIASALLWSYSSIKKPKPLNKKNFNRVAVAGFFLGLHFACFFWGVRNTSIANATLLGNTGPVFTVILTLIFYRIISKKVFFSLLVAMLGIFLIQRSSLYDSSSSSFGNVISLLSGLCIAIVYMLAKNIRKENNNISYGRTLFFFAAVTIGVLCIVTGESLFSFELKDLKWFLFLGVVPSILGHNSLNYALRYLSPTAIASVPLGEPVIASIFGWFLFGEEITKNSLEGAPFVLIGIYFIVKASNAKKT